MTPTYPSFFWLCSLRKSSLTKHLIVIHRDEPFRSVFATQMATKGSWGAPSRMQMYSPDAYSEAGTSESSGEGKLLKTRQTRGGRLDFQVR